MSWAATPWSTDLQEQWRHRTQASTWTFPSDWDSPACEAVCEALCEGKDFTPAAERLGRSRAAAGVSLAETLADVDVLAGLLLDPAAAEPLRRAVSLGWADGIQAPPVTVSDPLTGLVTAEYLKVRLGEVYQAAEVSGVPVSDSHAFVVVRMPGRSDDWVHGLPMILVADVMRTVFDGGRTHGRLGRSVAVVLAERDTVLARRARLLCTMIAAQMPSQPGDAVAIPSVWIENLPPTYSAALALMGELGR